MLSDVYAAGFFDGEGWVGTSTKRRKSDGAKYPKSLRTAIGQTNKAILELFREKWDGNISKILRPLPAKTFYQWECKGATAELFLQDISPYLILKRREVDVVLLFRKRQLERQKIKGRNTKLDKAELIRRENLIADLTDAKAER